MLRNQLVEHPHLTREEIAKIYRHWACERKQSKKGATKSKQDWCCSATQSCPALCNSMNCSTPGFPVLLYLPEFAQTHVYWVNDAIQPSHPLSYPSPLAFIFPSVSVFFNESTLCIRWPKYWSFSISRSDEYSGLISFRIDWLDLCHLHFAIISKPSIEVTIEQWAEVLRIYRN